MWTNFKVAHSLFVTSILGIGAVIGGDEGIYGPCQSIGAASWCPIYEDSSGLPNPAFGCVTLYTDQLHCVVNLTTSSPRVARPGQHCMDLGLLGPNNVFSPGYWHVVPDSTQEGKTKVNAWIFCGRNSYVRLAGTSVGLVTVLTFCGGL